jgi:general secretion pathway protein L
MSLLGIRPGHGPGHIGARLRTGAGRFLHWWSHALASWLPLRWRRVLGMDRGRLLLQLDGADLQLRLQRGDELDDLGRLPLAPAGEGMAARLAAVLAPRVAELPRWLLVPPAHGLRRRMSLPAAAAERLRDVVGFEIDRQTPFSADAVAFDARVLRRREADGQVDAELVVVPRHVLDPQQAALGDMAADLCGIDVADAGGTPLGVNLLPPAQRRRHRDPWLQWNLALAAVALVATAALLWQLLDNRRGAAEAFEQRIASDADAGRRAATERRELVTLIEGQAFLDRARAERPASIEIVDELTRRLPDGTYLEKLSIDDRQLMLIGLSADAAALIGQLQGSTLWHSPALAGALQPDPASGRDRFTLVAGLGPAPAGAATAEEDADDGDDAAG